MDAPLTLWKFLLAMAALILTIWAVVSSFLPPALHSECAGRGVRAYYATQSLAILQQNHVTWLPDSSCRKAH